MRSPQKCDACGKVAVVATRLPSYSTELDHDGRSYSIVVADLDVLRCQNCGEIALDEAATDRLYDALRAEVGLLSPAEIKQRREALGIHQKQLAEYLGLSPSTLSRWENGFQIQQRCMDKLLRGFFDVPAFRRHLGVPAETSGEETGTPR